MKIQKLSLAVLAAAGLLAFSDSVLADDTNSTTAPKQDAPAAAGPGRRGPQMNVERQLDRLSEQLSLTEEQKPKVKEVLEEQVQKRQEIMQAAPEERRAKVQAIREELNKKMKEILTAEQFTKYEENQGRFGGGRRGGQGAPGGGAANPPQQ